MSETRRPAWRRSRLPLPIPGLALAMGEDRDAYSALCQAVTADIAPRDAIEIVLTQAIIDQIWQTQRWRLIEACLLAVPAPAAEAPGPDSSATLNAYLSARYNAVPQAASPEMDKAVQESEVPRKTPLGRECAQPRRGGRAIVSDEDRAAARAALVKAFQTHGHALEAVVRLRRRAEAQRDAAIRDLEHYRTSSLRSPALDIIDAQFVEIPPDDISPQARSQPEQRSTQHRSAHPGGTRPRQSERASARSRGRARTAQP